MAFTFTSSELSCQTCGNSCSNVMARMSSILIMRSCMSDGVQSDVLLPKTVMSDLDKEKPYLTLPIAVGKLRKVMG